MSDSYGTPTAADAEQLLRLLESDLPQEEADALNKRLDEDRRLRKMLARLLVEQRQISEIYREYHYESASPASHDPRPHRKQLLAAAGVGFISAAAAAVLVASVLSLWRPAETPLPSEVGAERDADAPGNETTVGNEQIARVASTDSADGTSVAADPPGDESLRQESTAAGHASAGRRSTESVGAAAPPEEGIATTVPDAVMVPSNAPGVRATTETVARPEHVAYVEAENGLWEVSRSGSPEWKRSHLGVTLSGGDRLRTSDGSVRVGFYSGTTVVVNRFTEVGFITDERPAGVSVPSGEILLDVSEHDGGFFVDTPHGRTVDLGTRFGVEVGRLTGTTVLVAKGLVEASTDIGSAEISTREEVKLSGRRAAPGIVRTVTEAELQRRLKWAGALPGGSVNPYGPVRLSEGLVAYWRFDRGSGRYAYDASGHGHRGTLLGVRRSWGYAGGALRFEGPNEHLRTAAGTGLRSGSGITIAAWVRIKSMSPNRAAIAGLGTREGLGIGLALAKDKLDLVAVVPDPRGKPRSRSLSSVAGGRLLERNRWHHVAGTWSSSGGHLRTYVDGAADRTGKADVRLELDFKNFYAGRGPGARVTRIRGLVDELCLYSRALSESEIRTLASWPAGR